MRALALIVFAASCAPPPVYDDELGVQAEPAPVGSLAGTFALKTVNSTLVHAGPFGDQQGGGVNFRRVERTWDDLAAVYTQTSQLCGGFNFPVLDLLITTPESTYRAVAPSEERVVVDHDRGTFEETGHIQLWALKDLPDPYTTELPTTKEEAAEEPHASRIFDMDDDGNPGITSFATGPIEGEIYVMQRKTVALDGVILGPDRALGLAANVNEALTLGTDNSLLDRQSEGSAEPFPDKKESWFEQVRLDDDADCDDVMAASEDGRLSRLSPLD
jgi:hypothetical protein